MLRKLVVGALSAMVVSFSATAFAQGTAAEAKAMLEKAVVAVKADKAKALDMINKGEGGFLDRDLYVFCFNLGDGKTIAAGSNNARKLLAPADYGRWLSDEPDPGDLMRPFPAGPMRMWPISTRVNKPEYDDPSIVEPIALATSAA